jgi:hypothetical protein
MKDKDSSDSSCFALVLGLGLVVFVIHQLGELFASILKYFAAPGFLLRSVDTLKTLGYCLGAAVLFIIGGIIWFKVFPPKDDGGDYNDGYY